ncbi:hypothetical protein [Cellulomonas triticagri]|uniref:Uncharacterized protein n=1 Tax=Cellulomonas triticagri TaxID=2483352 RepID=A0A3M2JFE6_9CELL|nr:hypothetical protein [Cellulomonas triticagri]RMI09705.1 hypothetical protein EBM89_09310 [Cellulomonas triticagri]
MLSKAGVRAAAVAGHVQMLREQIVDADEWTSDSLFAADVDTAVGDELAKVAGELGYVLGHLDRDAARVPVPGDAHVHVRRAYRVREIAALLAAGASPAQVAADLGIKAGAVLHVLGELDALPADRRPEVGAPDPAR